MNVPDKVIEYHNYHFVDWEHQTDIDNNVNEQAQRIEATLSSNPDMIYDFLAQPIWATHKDTIKAVNLALDHIVDEVGEEEWFDKVFGDKQWYNSWSIGNHIAEEFFKERL